MPQFAWANDPEAIEEVMTFVLGLTGEKIASKYLPKRYNARPRRRWPRGRRSSTGTTAPAATSWRCPSTRSPTGTRSTEAFTDFKTNVRSSYSEPRERLHSKEFYPDLTYDPKKKLDAENIEAELGIKPDDGAQAVTIEGMPIGLFENELTVQLWKPVTIRGYTFNVGDNVTLDQTKVQKTPAEGGTSPGSTPTYQAEKTGGEFAAFWNRLPPPLSARGRRCRRPG